MLTQLGRNPRIFGTHRLGSYFSRHVSTPIFSERKDTKECAPKSSSWIYAKLDFFRDRSIFRASGSYVVGNVKSGRDSSFFTNVVLRGDVNSIQIGEKTNVQDNTVVHVSAKFPTTIGNMVTIGHSCIIHACTIEDNVIIGMGSIIMDGAIIRSNSIVGAGSLVTKHSEFPPNSIIYGRPAVKIRDIKEQEIESIKDSANRYVRLKNEHMVFRKNEALRKAKIANNSVYSPSKHEYSVQSFPEHKKKDNGETTEQEDSIPTTRAVHSAKPNDIEWVPAAAITEEDIAPHIPDEDLTAIPDHFIRKNLTKRYE